MNISQILIAISALTVVPAQAIPLQFSDVSTMARQDAEVVFKGMRVDTYIPNAALADTLGLFMGIPGGPDGDTPVLFKHFAMIEGCRHHSCIEKAAVIVNIKTREVAAVALRSYQCTKFTPKAGEIGGKAGGHSKETGVRCNDEPILDMYAVRSSANPSDRHDEDEHLAKLRHWGKSVGHQGERFQTVIREQVRPMR